MKREKEWMAENNENARNPYAKPQDVKKISTHKNTECSLDASAWKKVANALDGQFNG